MKAIYCRRILAKARKKYGIPDYPGRKEKSHNSNDVEVVKTETTAKSKKEETVHEIWKSVKNTVKVEISPVSYETWIESCKPLGIKHDKLVLLVENGLMREMIERRYLIYLQKAVKLARSLDISGVKLITMEEYMAMGGQ